MKAMLKFGDEEEQRLGLKRTARYLDRDKVLAIQRALDRIGIDPGPIDGQYGPRTKSAIIVFQRSHGLTTDGIVGPKTASALNVE